MSREVEGVGDNLGFGTVALHHDEEDWRQGGVGVEGYGTVDTKEEARTIIIIDIGSILIGAWRLVVRGREP
jgi:hypothetical protein